MSDEIHRIICENSPIPTADFILTKDSGRSFCLITRVGNRWPDVKWFFGGRQRIGETILDALERIAWTEAGVHTTDVISITFSHTQDVYNPASEPGSKKPFPAVHTIMRVYTIEVKNNFNPTLDATSKDAIWYTRNNIDCNHLPGPVIEALVAARLINPPST